MPNFRLEALVIDNEDLLLPAICHLQAYGSQTWLKHVTAENN